MFQTHTPDHRWLYRNKAQQVMRHTPKGGGHCSGCMRTQTNMFTSMSHTCGQSVVNTHTHVHVCVYHTDMD